MREYKISNRMSEDNIWNKNFILIIKGLKLCTCSRDIAMSDIWGQVVMMKIYQRETQHRTEPDKI